MHFFANIKLSRMIMAVAGVPIIAVIFFSSQIVMKEFETSKAIENLSQLTQLAVTLGNLVNEQQKERGTTAVFVGSSGVKFTAELNTQRQQTNKKRKELKKFLSRLRLGKFEKTFNQNLTAVMTTLGKMDALRKRVDALTVTTSEAISYYTSLNTQILKLIEYMGSLSPNTMIYSRFVGFSNFLEAKDRAGIERAVGAISFASGKFTPDALDKLKVLISIQNTYNDVFLSQATDGQKDVFNKVMSSSAANEVQRMRKIAFASGLSSNLEGITGKDWFETITRKITGLKQIEDTLSANLLDELAMLKAEASRNLWWVIAISLITLILVGGLCILIIRSINKSFSTVILAMKELAEGNLDVSLPPVSSNEIGDIIKCVEVFKDNAIEKVALEKQQKETARQSEVEKKETMQKLANDFDSSVGAIISTISSASTQLDCTAQSMASISEETSSQASAVAAASEQTAANVQTVASATEEMSASILEINNQVSSASQASKKAVEDVATTADQMSALALTVNKIGEVVSLISDIAEQTNLLALNATIESARAGEAGKGFAVVASEVKTLASETAKATESISEYIQEIQSATGDAVTSIDNIGHVIQKLEESSTAIAAAMEEQGATTQEVARNIQEVAAGTQEVSSNIAGVTQASQEAGAASGEVTEATGELSRQAEILRNEVSVFLQGLREGDSDRRADEDSTYSGPEKRQNRKENVAA